MRRILVLAAVVAVAVLVIGAGVLAFAPPPVEFGSSSGYRDGPLFVSRVEPDADGQGGPGWYHYLMQPGGHFAVVVSVRNTGPVPISILDSQELGYAIAFRLESLALVDGPNGESYEDWTSAPPLASVELAPGDEVRLWAIYRIRDACADGTPWMAGSSGGRSVIPIRYRELGLERTAEVQMRYGVTLDNPGPDTVTLCR